MKKLLMILLTLSMVIGMPTAVLAAGTSYTDVSDTHWSAESIANCTEKGIMQGTGDNKFSPEGTLTRAEVAQICYNAYKDKLPNMITNKTLSDVAADAWYRDAMYWVVANSIVNSSTDDALVYPNAIADRKFVALALSRLATKLNVELPKTVAAVTFPDISELDKEYQASIGALQQAGVISGFPDGTYQPNGSLTRAQAAKLFDVYTNIEGLKPAATTTQPEPTPPPTTSSADFLSNKICEEVREYALSVGFEKVTDYTDSFDGWQINIHNASTGNCKTLGLRLAAGCDYWKYGIITHDSYQTNVESGRVYNIEEMKALILRCSNY